MTDIPYFKVSKNAKKLADLLFPPGTRIRKDSPILPDQLVDFIMPGYTKELRAQIARNLKAKPNE